MDQLKTGEKTAGRVQNTVSLVFWSATIAASYRAHSCDCSLLPASCRGVLGGDLCLFGPHLGSLLYLVAVWTANRQQQPVLTCQ